MLCHFFKKERSKPTVRLREPLLTDSVYVSLDFLPLPLASLAELQCAPEAADGAPAAPQPQDFSGKRSGDVKAGLWGVSGWVQLCGG